ncbi:MAG: alanyl-tRNA synthetase [Candidatus Diapherotrites archaeon]|nr:alanyl-tRNA synthetase [Candidatus Diapherotrites archaeon]
MVDKKVLKKKFQEEWEKHYKLQFFEDMGFVRKKCKVCGQTFWTLDPDREVCGEPEHNGYQFIGNPAGKRRSYTETWDAMAEFYAKNGHTIIDRYPVVARWRDDLYFTIASIAVFQPYAVAGEVEPPANPLLIPQPCLRFKDVENVGLSGRHFTNFVMVGQHAFNRPDKEVLWKNEAIELIYRFMTEAVGIPKEEIVFHEDVWAGGGNFGPSIEYFVRGLELGNVVFMQFKETDDGYEQLQTRVIDHGIGLSRFAWISNGTRTAYDVVFPSVMEYLKEFYTPDVPETVLNEFAKMSGKLNFDEVEDMGALMREIEQKLNYPNFFEQYRPFAELYAIGDHTKTLLFAVNDGAFPSNVGGGYNLRVLARRIFSDMDRYGWDIDLGKVFELHAKDVEPMFPELKEAVDLAVDVMEEERKKYHESKRKAKSRVITLVKKKGTLDVNDFVTLYQSYGITPEDVRDITGIEPPAGIYSIIEEAGKQKVKKKEEESELPDVEGIPKTYPLYYDDVEMMEFEARVLKVIGDWVILDKTAFYPEGGGQDADTGELNGVPVVDVRKTESGVILHLVKDGSRFREGETVIGKINETRRRRHMRHHTTAHLILAAARRVLGKHVWQAGAHKSEDIAHIDLTHYKRITDEELREIERLANEYVMKNIPVKTYWMGRTEAEQKFGVILYQGGAVPGKVLRIVEIDGTDAEACGGTHVKRTGDIGLIKIVKRESVADGVERIIYKSGDVALAFVQEREERLKKAAEVLRVPVDEVPAAAEKMFNQWKDAEKRAEKLAEELTRYVAEYEKERVILLPYLSQKMAERIAEKKGKPLILIGRSGKPNVFVYADNAGEIIKKLGVRGGGKGDKAMGVTEEPDEVYRRAREVF